MDYLKKSLKKFDMKMDYEEIDTRIASGWYVDEVKKTNKFEDKKYKTKKVYYKISKKIVK